MKAKKREYIVRAQPYERFRFRSNRRLRSVPGAVGLVGESKYYFCPKCDKRTRIRRAWLDAWNPQPSIFPTDLLQKFPDLESHSVSFDLYCKGCQLPVRLVFWEQESGMGGSWYPVIKEIQELIQE